MVSLLRISTAGSVDDGKSTLIGRLLHDAKGVFEDQLDAVTTASRRRGGDGPDLSLLVDGLRAEREQGITIDVAYRYFATPRRSFVVADSPGHVEYTRNMVTAASTASVAIVLVDATNGVVEQSRRHASIAGLLGVHHIVLAVNKMDLVDFDEERFVAIRDDFARVADRRGIQSWSAVPVSATCGDNVVSRSERTPWYEGPALLELLETIEIGSSERAGARLPVQMVIRPRDAGRPEHRGYAGRVATAELRVGDEVTVLPRGRTTSVVGIDTFDGTLQVARPGRSVVVRLADDIDVSRGDVLAAAPGAEVTSTLSATVCWLSDGVPLRPGGRLTIASGTWEAPVMVEALESRLDVASLETRPADELALNDIGEVRLRTGSPMVTDPYVRSHVTGGFLLLDPADGGTVGAGLVNAAR